MDLSQETILVAVIAIGAILYVIKRLSTFDLEVLAHRERQRARYLAQRSRRTDVELLVAGGTKGRTITRDLPDGRTITLKLDEEGRYVIRHVTKDGRTIDSEIIGTKRVGTQASRSAGPADIPAWVLALLDPEEAERCTREWAAHLHGRIDGGEFDAALTDRRQYIRYALAVAFAHRTRRARGRSR